MTLALPLSINPYKVGPPVAGSDFFGRRDLLTKVRSALHTSNVVFLQGQRRIGKTSFLQHFVGFLAEGSPYPPLIPVLFDIQRYVEDSLPQFQHHLAGAIARSCQLTPPEFDTCGSDPTYFQDQWLPQV